MSLPRTFVGFSSADIRYYRIMCAWKAHEHIDFDFADFQLDEAINSENEYYIKQVCRNKIRRAETYALLIGNNTFLKTTFVKWEIEVAIEKGCRLIGINLNNSRFRDALCPYFFQDKGGLFLPFSSRIIAFALTDFSPPTPQTHEYYYYLDAVYQQHGYQLIGDTAVLPEPPNPFAEGNRPPWAR